MSRQVVFSQVDVFSTLPFQGNPLAVVFDAGGLTDRQMLDITRWMNLSETTFVVPAKQPGADYHVRIFTPDGELPFAGHPTLGTAHALLEQGLIEEKQGKVIQECAAGLITVRRQNDQSLAFLVPETVITPFTSPLTEALTGPLTGKQLQPAIGGIGSRWLLLPVPDVTGLRALTLTTTTLEALEHDAGVKGVVLFAPVNDGSGDDYEVRVIFSHNNTLVEDPVTGSANACLAWYFAGYGQTRNYRVRQGLSIGRHGCLDIRFEPDGIWVGGHSSTRIRGKITLP